MKYLFDNLRKYIPLMIQCFFSYSLNVTCEAENFEKFLKKIMYTVARYLLAI